MGGKAWRRVCGVAAVLVLSGCAILSPTDTVYPEGHGVDPRAATLERLANEMAELRRTMAGDSAAAERMIVMEGDLRLMANRLRATSSSPTGQGMPTPGMAVPNTASPGAATAWQTTAGAPTPLGPSVAEPMGSSGAGSSGAGTGTPAPTAATADFGEGQFALHLASYREQDSVATGARELRRRYDGVLGSRDFRTLSVHLGDGRGTFHRLKAGPFASRADATQACQQITSQGGYCAVEDFTGSPVRL